MNSNGHVPRLRYDENSDEIESDSEIDEFALDGVDDVMHYFDSSVESEIEDTAYESR